MKTIAEHIIKVVFADKKDLAGAPYIDHLHRVALNSQSYVIDGYGFSQESLEIIALLHDLLEDFPEWSIQHVKAIFKVSVIADALQLLTHKEDEPYESYIVGIKGNMYARAVKLADLVDNMDITRLPKITDRDIERIKKYHKAYRYLISLMSVDATTKYQSNTK